MKSCKIYFHQNGNSMAFVTTRLDKNKKQYVSGIEIFSIDEKNVALYVVDLKECVKSFTWEPTSSNRFAVITSLESPENTSMPVTSISQTNKKTNIEIYYRPVKKGKVSITNDKYSLFGKVEGINLSYISWSPRGRHIISGSLFTPVSSDFLVYDANFRPFTIDGVKKKLCVEKIASFDCTDISKIEWDFSGRYLIFSSFSKSSETKSGYKLYDIKGKLLNSHNTKNFKSISWRPHPPSLLSEKQKADIKQNFEKYAKEFEEYDTKHSLEISKDKESKKDTFLREWRQVRDKLKELVLKELKLKGIESEVLSDSEEIEEVVEELIEEKTEVIG